MVASIRTRAKTNRDILIDALSDESDKKILFITGAGISTESGVPVYRKDDKCIKNEDNDTSVIWNTHIEEWCTRQRFLENPMEWYKQFWRKTHDTPKFRNASPNSAHFILAEILQRFPNRCRLVTQNIDGLHFKAKTIPNLLIEAHGRLGVYRCSNEACVRNSLFPIHPSEITNLNSSTDNTHENAACGVVVPEEDEEEGGKKVVSLHLEKESYSSSTSTTSTAPSFSFHDGPTAGTKKKRQRTSDSKQIAKEEPPPPPALKKTKVQNASPSTSKESDVFELPLCPDCMHPCLPMSLTFDESYDCHSFFQWQKAQDWMLEADIIVFIGTSFKVHLTDVALTCAQLNNNALVYSLNIGGELLEYEYGDEQLKRLKKRRDVLRKSRDSWERNCHEEKTQNNETHTEGDDRKRKKKKKNLQEKIEPPQASVFEDLENSDEGEQIVDTTTVKEDRTRTVSTYYHVCTLIGNASNILNEIYIRKNVHSENQENFVA